MHTGRNPFTADEESLLVKYIAKYNPTTKGRSGNTLYRTLCADVDNKWKWSKSHTWQSWRDQYVKNPGYYDRRIKQYQKKHGISDESKPTMSKIRLKRDIESDSDYEEMEPPKRRKIGGGRGVKSVSGRTSTKSATKNEAQTGQKANRREQKGRRKGEKSSEAESRLPGKDDESLWGDSEEEGPQEEGSGQNDQNDESEEQVGRQLLDVSRDESQAGLDIRNEKPRDEIPYPALPIKNSTSSSYRTRSSVRGSQTTQPEASTSRVQLSPSHRVSSISLFDEPYKLPTAKSRKKRFQEDEEFFESDTGTPPPSEALSGPPHKQHRHKPPQLIEGPFGNAFAGARRTLRDASETESSEDESKEEVQTWPPPRKRKDSTGGSNVKETPAVRSKASLGKVPQNGSTSVKSGPNHNLPKVQETGLQNPPPLPAIHSAEEKARLNGVTPVQRREVQLLATIPQPSGLAEFLKPPQLNGTVMARGDKLSAPAVHQGEVIATPHVNGQESQETVPRDKRPEMSVNSETDSPKASSKSDLRVQPLSKSIDPRPPESRKNSSVPKMPRESWTPDDPFVSRSVGGKPQGRVDTFEIFDRRRALHLDENKRIDLREVKNQLWSRPSLQTDRHARTPSITSFSRLTPESSQTATSVSTRTANLNRSSRRSSLLPIPVADEDREKIDFLGMSAAIKMMAANFGFREESVWRMWKFFRNIGMTEEFCRRYRAKMGRMEEDVLEEMEKEGVDLDGLFKEREVEGMFVGMADVVKEAEDEGYEFGRRSLGIEGLSLGGEKKKERGNEPKTDLGNELQRSERRVSRSPMKEAQLRVRPWVEDDDVMSDYVPPHSSRAGQYARLLKQGRKEEALAREERCASGGRFNRRIADDSPTKQMDSTTPSLGNPGTAVLLSHAVVGRQNEDENVVHNDGEEEEEAEVQEEVEVAEEMVGEDDNGTSLPPESESVYDLLGDNTPFTEDEEKALLSASRANAGVICGIEQRVGADAMFLWTAARLGEFRDSYLSNIAEVVS